MIRRPAGYYILFTYNTDKAKPAERRAQRTNGRRLLCDAESNKTND